MPLDQLLQPLTAEQQALVNAVFKVKAEEDVWPNVHYLERTLNLHSVSRLIATFPTLGTVDYRAVWAPRVGGVREPSQEVGLTVVGLDRAKGGEVMIDPFLRFLRGVASRLHALPLSPTEVPTLNMRFGDLVATQRDGAASIPMKDVLAVMNLIRHEPPTWGGPPRPDRADEWMWADVPGHLARFGDVRDVESYLAAMIEFVGAPPDAVPRATLPGSEAIRGQVPVRDWCEQVNPVLREHVRQAFASGRWTTAVRDVVVHVEDEIRRRAGLSADVVGVRLIDTVFGTGGLMVIPKNGTLSEKQGWHQLARGHVLAFRNPVAHRTEGVDERRAFAIIGLASLILDEVDRHYPTALA